MSYIVDASNPEMVDAAKRALYDDIMNAVQGGTLWKCLAVDEAPDADEGDIVSFLLDYAEDETLETTTTGEG